MMKATNSRFPDDLGIRSRSLLSRSPERRVAKLCVDSVGVVVVDVLAEQNRETVLVATLESVGEVYRYPGKSRVVEVELLAMDEERARIRVGRCSSPF